MTLYVYRCSVPDKTLHACMGMHGYILSTRILITTDSETKTEVNAKLSS